LGYLALVEIPSVIIGFVTAVVAGIIIKLWLEYYYRPVLVIDGNETIIIRQIGLRTGIAQGNAVVLFNANRFRVRDSGRSAAKDCKAYIHYNDNDVERTAWLISNTNGEHTVTLNVEDREFVDLCAISDDVNLPRVIPLERGYPGSIDLCTRLPPGARDIIVRITSSNARPTERRVRLRTGVDHFPEQHGRIVEFID
jgi:hypothetical protein